MDVAAAITRGCVAAWRVVRPKPGSATLEGGGGGHAREAEQGDLGGHPGDLPGQTDVVTWRVRPAYLEVMWH
jgi:hypothetical protein